MIIVLRTLVGAFSVITNLRMELFGALVNTPTVAGAGDLEHINFSELDSLVTYRDLRPCTDISMGRGPQ